MAAVDYALNHGGLYFADINHNQVDTQGRRVLQLLAVQGEGETLSREMLASQLAQSVDLDATLSLLIHRELIEPVSGGYRFQVELIRRWFARKVKPA